MLHFFIKQMIENNILPPVLCFIESRGLTPVLQQRPWRSFSAPQPNWLNLRSGIDAHYMLSLHQYWWVIDEGVNPGTAPSWYHHCQVNIGVMKYGARAREKLCQIYINVYLCTNTLGKKSMKSHINGDVYIACSIALLCQDTCLPSGTASDALFPWGGGKREESGAALKGVMTPTDRGRKKETALESRGKTETRGQRTQLWT